MPSVVSAFGEGYTINNFLLSYKNTEIPYGFSGTLDTGKYVPYETIDYIALGPRAYIDENVYIVMYHDEIAKYHPMQSPSPQKSDTGEYNLFQSVVDGTPCTVCIDFDESGRSSHAFMKLGEKILSDSASEGSTLSTFSDFYGTWKLEEGSAILVVTQDAFGERPYTVTDVRVTYDSVEITFTVFEETFSYNERVIFYNGDSPLRMMLYSENAWGLFSGGTGFYKTN